METNLITNGVLFSVSDLVSIQDDKVSPLECKFVKENT